MSIGVVDLDRDTMKVSRKGLYALQAMMVLARRYTQGAIRIRDIAYEESLPEKFLDLILLELKNARQRKAGAMTKRRVFACACLLFLLAAVAGAQTAIRVGAFPNITHPQAMVGKNNGWFDKAMGPQVKIEW